MLLCRPNYFLADADIIRALLTNLLTKESYKLSTPPGKSAYLMENSVKRGK